MALSINKINERLEGVLKKLDQAIDYRDMTDVQKALEEAKKLNKSSDGITNEVLLEELQERIKKIAEEIKPNNGLDEDERIELNKIKKEIKAGKDPFEKTKAVVDSLSKKGVNQEDLKSYKEQQKYDNAVQIEAVKANTQELANVITNIEMMYIEPIQNNDEAIKIIKEIQKEKEFLENLDSSTDAETISASKSTIRTKISELQQRGVDVSSIQNFESNPSLIDTFSTATINDLGKKSNKIANALAADKSIPENIKERFGLTAASNTAKALKSSYNAMVKTRKKMATKIATLEAENRQIDKTIKTLDREEEIRSIAYNEDGTEKSPSEIARTVLNNDRTREQIVEEVSNKMDYKNPFKRFGARMNFYQDTQNVGKFKAFWKAAFSKTKNVKRIAATSEAVRIGKGMSAKASDSMRSRQENFRQTLKNETLKKMSKDATLTEDKIRDDVVEQAYESAFRDDDGR